MLGVAVGLLLALAATQPVGAPVVDRRPTSPPPAPDAWTGDPSLDAGSPPAAPASAVAPATEGVPETTVPADPPPTDPPGERLPPPVIDPEPAPADPPAAVPVIRRD